jgi:hypothetical protein
MYCDAPAAVAAIRKPVDTTHAGAGSVKLANGTSLEITKPDDNEFALRLRRTDRVQICYAPPQHFADAGPAARMAIAGIVRTGDYIFTLAYPMKTAVTPR